MDLLKVDVDRFMNSSLPQLVASLSLYLQYSTQIAENENGDEERSRLTNLFLKQLEMLDPKCIESDDNWWPLTIEVLNYGL